MHFQCLRLAATLKSAISPSPHACPSKTKMKALPLYIRKMKAFSSFSMFALGGTSF